jgi:predicted RNA binding protein YcfA (HicA-like mRNA interferase family)
MSLLPIISGRELIKVLIKLGYQIVRQRGSHIRLRRSGKKPITVPDHKELGAGLLRKIMRDAELSIEGLRDLFKR